jgi:hypothetical protein
MEKSNLGNRKPEQPEIVGPAQAGNDAGTTRRRLLKGAAAAAPMILTLRSGIASAQAHSSGCLDVVTFEKNVVPVEEIEKYTCVGSDFTEVKNTAGEITGYECPTGGTIVTASSSASLGTAFCN